MRHARWPLALAVLCVLASGCRSGSSEAPASADEAHRFIEAGEKRLEALSRKAARAGWVQNNFITVDTQQIAADAQSDFSAAVTELALGARRFDGLQLSEDDARKLKLL
jgi:peptidyl-dipeptidase A